MKIRVSAIGLLSFALLAAVAWLAPWSSASSLPGDISVSPATQTAEAGAPFTYSIAVSCAGLDSSNCGTEVEVHIPLSTSVVPSMVSGGWTYSASSASSGLITSGPTIDTSNPSSPTLIISLDPTVFDAGFSGTMTLTVTPPDSTTPNNTSWTLRPRLVLDATNVIVSGSTATATATASPQLSVSDATADGASLYIANDQVTYDIATSCTTPGAGNLYLTSATLTDVLPPDVTYISATPAPTSVSGNTLTWAMDSSSSDLPAGCASGTGGQATTFQVVTTAPPTAESNVLNTATFTGSGPDVANPSGVSSTATAQATIATILQLPVDPGGDGYASVNKTAIGPIPQPTDSSGTQYLATFPGNWDPVGSTPSYSAGQAAASYQATVSYDILNKYQSDFIDPVPCLSDSLSGGTAGFQSGSFSGTACSDPAFHTQSFFVWMPTGLTQAYADGWRPEVVDAGTSTPLPLDAEWTPGQDDQEAWFTVPSGTVGTVILPPSPDLEGAQLQLTLFGYADASLEQTNGGVNDLRNTVTVFPENPDCDYQGVSGTCAPMQWSADLYTTPQEPALGIAKSFGSLDGNGDASLTLTGSVASPTSLTHDVVMTDLLPLNMTLVNPPTTGNFSIDAGSANSATEPATISVTSNYLDTGRELLRITLSKSDFSYNNGIGYFYIAEASNLFTVHVDPTVPAIYHNDAQIFLYDLGLNPISTQCADPTQFGFGTPDASYENDNTSDFAGDGQLSEGYCQNSATLSVQATGADFSLTKTVQGDLDPVQKGPLGVGLASSGGTGVYRLTWTNVGSDQLNDAVVYDVLPQVGDTGVSGLEAGVARGSAFTPYFVSASADQGVQIEYSTAANPCRPEVYDDADNAGCIDDWSTSIPSNPSSVTALRFLDTGPFNFGAGFSMKITVNVPVGDNNEIAWNSAATNALDVSSPSTILLPAEPQKVGIETVAPDAPSTIVATPSTGSATVSWDAPSTNGTTLTGYVVQYSSDGGTTWHTASMCTGVSTSCTLTGLSAGQTYLFRVAASSTYSTGTYSNSSDPITLMDPQPTPATSLSQNAPTKLATTGLDIANLLVAAILFAFSGVLVAAARRHRRLQT